MYLATVRVLQPLTCQSCSDTLDLQPVDPCNHCLCYRDHCTPALLLLPPHSIAQTIGAHEINHFICLELDNCEELTLADFNKYLDIQENNENNVDSLLCLHMFQYCHLFLTFRMTLCLI